MLHSKLNKSLLAAQLSMWLPLAVFFLPSRLMGDSLLPLLLPVIAGWALAPVSALWNLLGALRALGTAAFDPWVLRTVMRHKIAMLPALAFNALLWFGAPLAMFNPWTMVLLPIAAVAIFFSVCCAWLSMLSTSVLVIGQLLLLWRQKALPLKRALSTPCCNCSSCWTS